MIIYFDSLFLEHRHAAGHPESPQRLIPLIDSLKKKGLAYNIRVPECADTAEILSVHSLPYVESILNRTVGSLDPETPVYPSTYHIASFAAGAAISSVSEALATRSTALALVRPPGHHAGKSVGGGFCYFNNVAVAVRSRQGMKTAIVDIDVHHGNGTSEIFYDDGSVLYISTHQMGIYPGTGSMEDIGSGQGKYFNVNIPLPAGAGDSTFDVAFEDVVIPVVSRFNPDFIVISLGTDAHYMDPLASLTLSTPGYLRCISMIQAIGKPVAVVLEGGYHPDALSDVVCGLVSAADNVDFRPRFDRVYDTSCAGRRQLLDVIRILSEYWDIVG